MGRIDDALAAWQRELIALHAASAPYIPGMNRLPPTLEELAMGPSPRLGITRPSEGTYPTPGSEALFSPEGAPFPLNEYSGKWTPDEIHAALTDEMGLRGVASGAKGAPLDQYFMEYMTWLEQAQQKVGMKGKDAPVSFLKWLRRTYPKVRAASSPAEKKTLEAVSDMAQQALKARGPTEAELLAREASPGAQDVLRGAGVDVGGETALEWAKRTGQKVGGAAEKLPVGEAAAVIRKSVPGMVKKLGVLGVLGGLVLPMLLQGMGSNNTTE